MVSFQTERLPCFGYRIGEAGKYLPNMHNSTQNTYITVIFFQEVTVLIMHAGKRYYGTHFLGGNI
jgi:hypothetical protein